MNTIQKIILTLWFILAFSTVMVLVFTPETHCWTDNISVTIHNSITGERKAVDVSQLSSYGIADSFVGLMNKATRDSSQLIVPCVSNFLKVLIIAELVLGVFMFVPFKIWGD